MKKIVKKEKILEDINYLSKNSISTIIIDYSRIKSTEMKYIRKSFFENKIDIKVFKNTLLKKCFTNTKNEVLCDNLKGQTLVVFSKIDAILPLKIINDFIKDYEEIKVKSICIYGNVFSKKNIDELINLPNKDTSLIKFKISMIMPLLKFNNSLKFMLNKFCFLLNAIKNKK